MSRVEWGPREEGRVGGGPGETESAHCTQQNLRGQYTLQIGPIKSTTQNIEMCRMKIKCFLISK